MNKTITLKPQRINHENFSGFGKVLETKIPTFYNEDFDWFENLSVFGFDKVEIGLVRVRNNDDYTQKTLERHNKTVELIMPVENDIILVLAKGDADKVEDFSAFYVPVGSAAAINEGIWHQAPMCLPNNKVSSAFILYSEGTGARDKEQIVLKDRGFNVLIDITKTV